jgi:hypothetical protein
MTIGAQGEGFYLEPLELHAGMLVRELASMSAWARPNFFNNIMCMSTLY